MENHGFMNTPLNCAEDYEFRVTGKFGTFKSWSIKVDSKNGWFAPKGVHPAFKQI